MSRYTIGALMSRTMKNRRRGVTAIPAVVLFAAQPVQQSQHWGKRQ